MISTQTLLGVLMRGQAPRKRGTGWRVLAIVAGVLLFAIYLGAAAYNLDHAWETGDWFGFWSSGGFTAFPLFFVIFIPLIFVFANQMPWLRPADLEAGARALRQAAAAGDDRIAPYTEFQPAPIPPEEMPQGETRIAALKRPVVPQSSSATIGTAVVAIFLILALMPLLFLGIDNNFFGFTGLGGSPFVGVFYPLIFVLFIPSIIIRARRLQRGRTFAVEVDGQGVRWRRGVGRSDQAEIRWDQVRSLFRVVGTVVGSVTADAYVLDSENASLVWTVAASASAAEFAASEALLRLIVTRTGQPLRDLSKVAAEVVRSGRNAERIWSARLPVSSGPLSGAATSRPQAGPPSGPLAPFPSLLATAPERKPRRVGLWLAGGAVVLLLALVYGGGAWVQYEQPLYLASLPARIHAETPLYQDTLSVTDSDWPVQYPSTGDVSGYGFANSGSGYQLYGSKTGEYAAVYGPGTYSDAAVEVTVTETGQPDPNNGDGVGLVLRGDAQTQNFLAFEVTYAGDWQLWKFHYVDSNPSDNWDYLAGGHSNAIQTGNGATNRLLVLMRGSVLNLYVNDQLVTTEYDKYEPLPTHGRVGLFLNDTALTGTFTNFAVYPVQPPSSLLYV